VGAIITKDLNEGGNYYIPKPPQTHPVTGKNPQFTAFLDSNLHTRLAIVTENELGLAFPPRNLPKKFRPDLSTFYLVIVVTNKQTDRQTNAGKNIIPHFRGDNNVIT